MTDNLVQNEDPFFSTAKDSEWNACIGIQGLEENYVDGYIEAAIELVSAVIDKRQYDKRDTLVMPILYNARHAVELSLKYLIGKLYAAQIVTKDHPKNHDIESHWSFVASAPLGDADLQRHINDLKPFVKSLHGIDNDGQQLRFATTQDGRQSLEDKAICNLDLIRQNLLILSKILMNMRYRVLALVEEHKTGTFTDECSRRDLFRITEMLPPISMWSDEVFTKAKTEVIARFNLSGGKFSRAVSIIKKHREMGSLLGYEFNLAQLSDDHVKLVAKEWSEAHPVSSNANDLGADYFKLDWDISIKYLRILKAAEEVVLSNLSRDEIADLETIFYMGRERLFSEDYEYLLDRTMKKHSRENILSNEVHHIMSKANLLECLAAGLEILGRRNLAAEIRSKRPDLTTP